MKMPKLALVACALLLPSIVGAQTITLKAGSSPTMSVAPGAKFAVPVIVDISAAGAVHIASFQTGMTWGSGRLTLDSLRTQAGTDFSVTPNLANAASGSIVFNAFAANNITATQTVTNAWFTAGSAGGTRIALSPSAAGDELAANILASLIPSGLDVCVATPGKWGDVNDDGNVNIIDAQQIARSSVGLSVLNAAALAARGDVTADGNVNIIDAQQIARFSVSLSAAARINTNLFTPPTVASIALTPNTPQNLAVGATTTLVAAPKDAGNVDLTGCAQVTYSSTNPAIATVNAGGTITGIANGVVTITATSVTQPGVTASISVTVGTGGGGSTGINVNVTSPFGGSHYYVIVDSGGLASPNITDFDAAGSKTPTIPVLLPAGTGYRVRILARDSLQVGVVTFPNVSAGTRISNVAVATGSMTVVNATLVNMTSTLTTPATGTAGVAIPVTLTLTDPSEVIVNGGGSPFMRMGFAAWTSDFTNTFTTGNFQSPTTNSVTSKTWVTTSAYTPVQSGTLFMQANYQSNSVGAFNFQYVVPSSLTRPNETLVAVPIAAAANGINVAITSPISVGRYVVLVDTGTFGGITQTVATFVGGPGTTANIQVPAAPRAGTGYRVRAVALDSTTFANGQAYFTIRAGARQNAVQVTAGSFTNVNLTLLPASVGTPNIPATASVGVGIPVSMVVNDSSQAAFCQVRTSATALTQLTSGSGQNCSFSAEGVGGSRTGAGTIPGQAAGTLFTRMFYASNVQLPDGRFVELGIRPASPDVQVVVSAPTTGISVGITSFFGASKYFVIVDSGGLATPQVTEFDNPGLGKTATIPISLPVGTGYRVRVAARDSLQSGTSNFPLIGAGTRVSNVNVVSGSLTSVPASLAQIATTFTLPGTGTAGTPVTGTVMLDDPSLIILPGTTNAFLRMSWSPWTTDLSQTFSSNFNTLSGSTATSKTYSGTLLVPGQVGTLSYQSNFQNNTSIGGFTFGTTAPAFTRAEPLRTLPVTAATQGIAVSITSPISVGRYVVAVDTGSGPPIIGTYNASFGLSASIQVPAPVRGGAGYRVRAVAVDSTGSLTNFLLTNVRAGARVTGVQVSAGSFTPVSLTLIPASISNVTVPATFSSGVQVPVSATVTDTSQITFCTVRYQAAALTLNGGLSGACGFGGEGPAGVRSMTGTIPPQAAGTSIFARVYSMGTYVLPEGRTIEVGLRAPGGDPQVTFAAITTGLRLNVVSPRAVLGYVVVIDSGGLAQQVGFKFNTFQRTTQLLVPLAAGTGYRVRVFGSDSASNNLLNVSTSVRNSNVAVTSGAITDVPATLAPMSIISNMPANGTAGVGIPVDITIDDPASLFSAALNQVQPGQTAPTTTFCPVFAWSTATFNDGFGSQLFPCSRAQLSTTQAQFTGATLNPSAGTTFWQARAFANAWTDGGLGQLVFVSPAVNRGQALNQIAIAGGVTQGIHLTVNVSDPAKRYLITVDSGGLGSPVAIDQPAPVGNSRSLTTNIALAPGTLYRVRVAVADSLGANQATNTPAVSGAGRARGITVNAGQLTNVTINANTFDIIDASFPNNVPVGTKAGVTWTVRDPSGYFLTTTSCSALLYSSSPITTDPIAAGGAISSTACAARTILNDSTYVLVDSIPSPGGPGPVSLKLLNKWDTGIAGVTATNVVPNAFQGDPTVVTINFVTLTTGIRVQATSPVQTGQFVTVIDGGGLAQPIIDRSNQFGTNSGSMFIAVPAGTGYNVRVFAVDQASPNPNTLTFVAASNIATGVAVTSGALTTVGITLLPASAAVTTTIPANGTLGTPVPYTFAVTDPSQVLFFGSQNSCAKAYMNFTPPTADLQANFGAYQNCGTVTKPSANVFQWATGSIPPLNNAGTMTLQFTAERFISNSTTNVTLVYAAQIQARGDALPTIAFSAGASKVIKATLTNNTGARTAKRYSLIVTGNGLSDAVSQVLNGTAMAGGVISLRVPGSGTYTVMAVGIDNSSPAQNVYLGGAQASLPVSAATETTTVSLSLNPAVITPQVANIIPVNTPIPVIYNVLDVSGSNVPVQFCGQVRWSTSPLASDFSGNLLNTCNVSGPAPNTLQYSGATIPAQASTGTVFMNFYSIANIRFGIGLQGVWIVGPSIMRGEATYQLPVVQVATVNVTPATPTVPVAGTQQMSAQALNAASGVITGLPITWSSSSPGVATVNSAGLVTGVANGTTTIQATIGGINGSTVVTVSGGISVSSITVALGTNALAGNASTTATPTVRDASNNIIGAAVTWSTSNRLVARVDAAGNVQALGAGSATITATIGAITGTQVLNVTSAPANFNITMRNRTSLTAPVQAAFTAAAAKWSAVLRNDLPDFVATNLDATPCLSAGAPSTILNETIDDVLIYVTVEPIDGVNGILGSAGPCYVRNGGGLTIVGAMRFDDADMANMQANGTLNAVILHEMGHVLGVGTLWGSLLANPATFATDPQGDPTFVGTLGLWGFATVNQSYGGVPVPVENCCSSGTRNAHWRESVLQRELMTGFVSNDGVNPMSPLTVGSLADIGYVVDMSQADAQPWFAIVGETVTEIKEGTPPPIMSVDPSGHVMGATRLTGPPVTSLPPAPPIRKQ
ncbi:MAG: metalloendopeptidase containing Ig-like domain [Gemmatimonadetes bacterium]|nr:metalloendopeptidase containing Ig-like domain [Gemmatimonadota bacterium]